MSTQDIEKALTRIVEDSKKTWQNEDIVRNLGATVENLMQRRGFRPAEFDDVDEDDFEEAA